jgi:hypothetical protein
MHAKQEQHRRHARCGSKVSMRIRLDADHTIPASTSLDVDVATSQRTLGLACPHLWGIYTLYR